MKPIPSSLLFAGLSWNLEAPEFPTLDGYWKLDDGRCVEIALVGDASIQNKWDFFIEQSEACAWRFINREPAILKSAHKGVSEMHGMYFPDRRKLLEIDLPIHLSLRLICFYANLPMHAWYRGDEMFNRLDVDLELTSAMGEMAVTEIRFDG